MQIFKRRLVFQCESVVNSAGEAADRYVGRKCWLFCSVCPLVMHIPLHTRLRLKSSQLNAHRYAQGKAESPSCSCGYPKEDTQHFLTLCPIYNSARATLLQKLSSVPNLAFSNLSRAQKMKVMITGPDGDYPTKKIVANAVQSFLLETQSRECIL